MFVGFIKDDATRQNAQFVQVRVPLCLKLVEDRKAIVEEKMLTRQCKTTFVPIKLSIY